MIYGSVLASFCVERFSLDRFRTLTRAEIDARFEEFRTRFDAGSDASEARSEAPPSEASRWPAAARGPGPSSEVQLRSPDPSRAAAFVPIGRACSRRPTARRRCARIWCARSSFSHDRIERSARRRRPVDVAWRRWPAVWNGRKGHVALLVRDVEPAAHRALRRLDDPITSEAGARRRGRRGTGVRREPRLRDGRAGVRDARRVEARDERIYRWNKLRKIRPARVGRVGRRTRRRPCPSSTSPSRRRCRAGYEIELEDLAVPSPPPAPDFDGEFSAVASPHDRRRVESGSRSAERSRAPCSAGSRSCARAAPTRAASSCSRGCSRSSSRREP